MKNKHKIIIILGFLCISFANAQNQWIPLTSAPNATLTSVYFVSADTGYVSSFEGNLYKTTNGGLNFNQINSNGPAFSLCFLNAHKGFGARDNYLLVTQNGGANWYTSYTNPNFIEIKNICFPDKRHGFATAWSNEVRIYVLKTINGGTTWDTIGFHDPNLPILQSVFFKDSLNGYLGRDDGKISKTTDGGISWATVQVDIAHTVITNSIYFPTADTGYAATIENGVYRTIDGGNTWNHLVFNFLAQLNSIWFTDANHGFVAGGDDINYMVLYKTIDGGNSWSQCLAGTHSLNAMYFVDSMPGYAVGNGAIFKFTNTTGIKDNELSNEDITIYPNPAKTNLYINGLSTSAIVEVYNISGKLLLLKPLYDQTIDISSLETGLYFIKFTTKEGCVVRKFVKE
ncbi:MAG: T9SS type A sorting domain-containing protein [Bacteroidota bacterium]